jgi:KDO2-lipid IV(A) lauroyltransferase
LFFFVAGPARKALLSNLRLIQPNSLPILNYFRVIRVFANFGWSLTDAATYRLKKTRFRYEIEGGPFLDKLGSADAAIILTAHMGNYDLGAAVFAAKFDRQIRMVRAPEPDALAAKHVDLALQESSAGAVKIGYSDDGTSLALDLLDALRAGEIISIQGDRVVGEMARAPVTFLQREILLPNGPFVLAYVSGTPIYPLFVVRTGRWKYKVIAHEPIFLSRVGALRDEIIAAAMQRWSNVLEKTVRICWPQWFAFKRLINRD